jgi:hypothetical protein
VVTRSHFARFISIFVSFNDFRQLSLKRPTDLVLAQGVVGTWAVRVDGRFIRLKFIETAILSFRIK